VLKTKLEGDVLGKLIRMNKLFECLGQCQALLGEQEKQQPKQ